MAYICSSLQSALSSFQQKTLPFDGERSGSERKAKKKLSGDLDKIFIVEKKFSPLFASEHKIQIIIFRICFLAGKR
jgi:hypothetical protein